MSKIKIPYVGNVSGMVGSTSVLVGNVNLARDPKRSYKDVLLECRTMSDSYLETHPDCYKVMIEITGVNRRYMTRIRGQVQYKNHKD